MVEKKRRGYGCSLRETKHAVEGALFSDNLEDEVVGILNILGNRLAMIAKIRSGEDCVDS
jgi:hypothetical protein